MVETHIPKTAKVTPMDVSCASDGYKVVKVRKPDGTIVKVRRPIAKDGVAATKSLLPNPSSPAVAPLAGTSPSTLIQSSNTAEEAEPKLSANLSTTEAPSRQLSSPKKSPEISTSPTHASKVESSAKGYRIFRRFHRASHHTARLVAAFDPYSDVGDLQDGDEYLESDDDYDSASQTSDTDDSDRRGASNEQKTDESGNLNVKSQATTPRAAPAPKSATAKISVKELPKEKTSLGDKNSIVKEREVLGSDTEAAKPKQRAPRSLHRRSADWVKLIVWALVILFPVGFVGLGIAVATLKSTPFNSRRGNAIEIANRAAITMWPIVFAAIVAQTLKALATYRVERGIRLLTLEQLISSHSVASALKQPFILRSLNWISIGLLALWGLSPLGSQAMQYTIGNTDNHIDNAITVNYLNTAQDNTALQVINTDNQLKVKDSFSDSMAVLYAAVFQPVSEYQPVGSDPWGNPLVPVYEIISSLNNSVDYPGFVLGPDGNITITSDAKYSALNSVELYSSFYGIPFSEIGFKDETSTADDLFEDGVTWTYTMNSSYLHFDCPGLASRTESEIDLGQFSPLTNLNGSGTLSMDMLPPTSTTAGSLYFRSNCSSNLTPDGNKTYAYAVCSFSQTFVESTVLCNGALLECGVTSIKNYTSSPTSMYDFVDEFLKASDVGVDDFPALGDSPYSATELFLLNPDNVTQPGVPGVISGCNLPDVDPAKFNKRLSYLLNTFYSTGFTTEYEFMTLEAEETVPFYDDNDNYTTATSGILTTQTDGSITYLDPAKRTIYTIDQRFLAIFMICSVALLIVGVSGVMLEMRTISPDILGFASSVARHSKYVKLPETDGTMSGAEKARRLGDARVMMQDVRPNAEVGRIVLGSASEDASRLKSGRLYR